MAKEKSIYQEYLEKIPLMKFPNDKRRKVLDPYNLYTEFRKAEQQEREEILYNDLDDDYLEKLEEFEESLTKKIRKNVLERLYDSGILIDFSEFDFDRDINPFLDLLEIIEYLPDAYRPETYFENKINKELVENKYLDGREKEELSKQISKDFHSLIAHSLLFTSQNTQEKYGTLEEILKRELVTKPQKTIQLGERAHQISILSSLKESSIQFLDKLKEVGPLTRKNYDEYRFYARKAQLFYLLVKENIDLDKVFPQYLSTWEEKFKALNLPIEGELEKPNIFDETFKRLNQKDEEDTKDNRDLKPQTGFDKLVLKIFRPFLKQEEPDMLDFLDDEDNKGSENKKAKEVLEKDLEDSEKEKDNFRDRIVEMAEDRSEQKEEKPERPNIRKPNIRIDNRGDRED